MSNLLSLYRRTAITVLLTSVACSGGEKTITEPPPPPPPSPAVVTLIVSPDAADNDVAQPLGWTAGVPGAEVTLSNQNVSRNLLTDASGKVVLSGVPAGRYWVEARRILSAAELANVAAASGTLLLAGADSLEVRAVTSSITLPIPASRRRSLVISEYAWSVALAIGVGRHEDGGYFELYNNGDTTVYLDGIGIGFAYDLFVNGGIATTQCGATAPLRNDPQGLWVQANQVFPGGGREHPVPPGGIVTVAQDAIDHAPFFAGMPDLRNADFEFIGPGDVDNPSVPNMINRSFDASLALHGMPSKSSGAPLILFAPVDLATLPQQKDTRNERLWWRIPASRILDVSTKIPPVARVLDGSALPFCNPVIPKNFDRAPGLFIYGPENISFTFSPQRKVIGTSASGKPILQVTGSSAVDFSRLPVTPFQLP